MQNVFDRVGNKIGSVSFVLKTAWGKYYNTAECLNKDGAGLSSVYKAAPPYHRNYSLLYLLYALSFLYLIWSFLELSYGHEDARAPARAVLVH